MRTEPSSLAEIQIAHKHDASSNADAAVTIAADVDHIHVIDRIFWSYSGTPTAGRLTVSVGGTVVFDHDIRTAGPGFFPFRNAQDEGLYGSSKNQAVVVTLYAGASGVTGKLTVFYR